MSDLTDLKSFEKKVDLYFDRALSQSDERDLLKTVEEDESCKKIFQQAENYRSFLKNKVHRPQISSDFIRSIKDKIRVV